MNDFKFSKKLLGVPLISASFSKSNSDEIPLSFGYPSPDTFPVKELMKATEEALSLSGDTALQYSGGEGKVKLVEWIKNRVKHSNIDVLEENILITTGSGQAIDLITRTLTDPGDSIGVEAPTYFGAIRSFLLAEVDIKTYLLDKDGMKIEELELELMQAKENKKEIPKFIYVISNHHNPQGVSLSIERRKKLAELAYKYDFFIIEDDAYGELSFDEEKMPSIFSFSPERVLYIGSFSKLFGPGLRIGWIIGNPEVLTKIRTLKSDGNTSVFIQEIMSRMLDEFDFESHLKNIKNIYKKRRDLMVKEINKQFNNHITFNVPKGGFFIWLTFPKNVNTNLILEEAKDKYKVNFFASEQFYIDDKEYNHMRLCFSYCNESQIVEGIYYIAKTYFSIYK